MRRPRGAIVLNGRRMGRPYKARYSARDRVRARPTILSNRWLSK